jgi:GNAT superfamily N-acetyltransferase
MFEARIMSSEDLEFAVRITDQMGWHLAREDFEFMKELEPEGCFVMLSDLEKIGIATTISFGKVGWFGNLIVNGAYRKKGAGSLLVKHALQYLKTKKVETVGLYAYIERIPFYERLGFTYDSEFTVLSGKAISSRTKALVKKAGKEDVQKIIDYDGLCFGASRGKLLEPVIQDLDNLCYFVTEKGEIAGYGVAKVYRGMAEIGPLICSEGRSDVPINLLRAMLNRLGGLEVSMCVPTRQKRILGMLRESGVTENFKVVRMFLGASSVRECVCAAESLERG